MFGSGFFVLDSVLLFVVCVARISLQTLFKTFERLFEVVGVDYVGKTYFVFAETRSSVETSCGSHHNSLIFIAECFKHPAAEIFAIVDWQTDDCVKRAFGHRAAYAFDFV